MELFFLFLSLIIILSLNTVILFIVCSCIIAKKSHSEKLLLTHFWPEIPKEKYLEEVKEIFPNTEGATENKTITPIKKNI